jgi:hypothetical protein
MIHLLHADCAYPDRVLGRVAALILLLGGCDQLFALPHIDPVAMDGRGMDGSAAPCVVEAFEQQALGPMWRVYNVDSPATVEPVGGKLVVEPPMGQSAYNGIYTAPGFDVAGGFVQVELIPLGPGNTDAQLIIAPTFAVESHFLIYVSGGSFIGFRKTIDGTDEQIGETYSAANDRFVRIRFGAGEVVYETSTTGAATGWIERHRLPADLPLTNLHVMLLAGTYDPPPSTPGQALYDDLKICAAGQQ